MSFIACVIKMWQGNNIWYLSLVSADHSLLKKVTAPSLWLCSNKLSVWAEIAVSLMISQMAATFTFFRSICSVMTCRYKDTSCFWRFFILVCTVISEGFINSFKEYSCPTVKVKMWSLNLEVLRWQWLCVFSIACTCSSGDIFSLLEVIYFLLIKGLT